MLPRQAGNRRGLNRAVHPQPPFPRFSGYPCDGRPEHAVAGPWETVEPHVGGLSGRNARKRRYGGEGGQHLELPRRDQRGKMIAGNHHRARTYLGDLADTTGHRRRSHKASLNRPGEMAGTFNVMWPVPPHARLRQPRPVVVRRRRRQTASRMMNLTRVESHCRLRRRGR